MAVRITDTHIRGLAPGKEVRDAVEPGLAIRRQGEGGVSFVFVWQKDGKARRHTLGRYGVMTLAEAREAARKVRPALIGGTSTITTVNGLLDGYLATLGKSKGQVTALLAKHVRPAIGTKPLLTLHRRDVQGVVDRVSSASTAISVGRYLTAALVWGEKRGHVEHAIRNLDLPEGGAPRQRTLTDAELKAVLADALPRGPGAMPRSSFGAIVVLAMLTAGRRTEISELAWSEIAGDVIHLSAARSKGNRPTTLILSPHALQVLGQVPKRDDEILFPVERPRAVPGKADSRPGRSGRGFVSGFSTMLADLHTRTGTGGWTLHDLRRTAATWMANEGVMSEVIEATLNHAAPRLVGTYQATQRDAARRAALAAWGTHLWGLMGWEQPKASA